jgi:hypothetical protein
MSDLTQDREFSPRHAVGFFAPMAGKHQYAEWNWIKAEPEVKAILSKK